MKRAFFLLVLSTLFFVNISTASNASSTTSTILMVPPDGFGFNSQTAKSNAYQHPIKDVDFRKRAIREFHSMVSKLRENGVTVIILRQDKTFPDAVFPNNWFSTHVDNHGKTTLILYPMLTSNRQAEVNPDGLQNVLLKSNITIEKVIELRDKNSGVLEGTGSMVLDREHHIIYASLSARTSRSMVDKVAKKLHYTSVIFNSVDGGKKSIYHTNVIMGLAKNYSIVCLECIQNKQQRKEVISRLRQTHKLIIPINQDQVSHMCGNTIELTNNKNESLLVMSRQAYQHFNTKQLKEIAHYSRVLPMDLNTIESIGGGSARCMIAEIFSTSATSCKYAF